MGKAKELADFGGVVTVDGSGNVGVGTSTSLSKLTSLGGASTVANSVSTRNPVASFRGGNDNNRLDVLVDNSGSASIMGLSAWNVAGANSELAFYTGTTGAEAMRITSTGSVELPKGQLKFPATQNASSDANTLDDYEEGTWTPTITGSSTNPTVTYVAQSGFYTKIGRTVNIQGRVGLNGRTGGSGNFRLSGLPFANGGGLAGAGTSWFSFVTLSTGSGYSMGGLYIEPNNTYLSFAESGNNVSANQLGISAFGNQFDITFTFTYIV